MTGAQVVDMATGTTVELVQGHHMTLSHIDNMDIVPHRCAVGGGIVGAEHSYVGITAGCDSGYVWHEIGAFRRQLADQREGWLRPGGSTKQRDDHAGSAPQIVRICPQIWPAIGCSGPVGPPRHRELSGSHRRWRMRKNAV